MIPTPLYLGQEGRRRVWLAEHLGEGCWKPKPEHVGQCMVIGWPLAWTPK
ncbi:hypothetical protein [Streptomyces sp. 8N706]